MKNKILAWLLLGAFTLPFQSVMARGEDIPVKILPSGAYTHAYNPDLYTTNTEAIAFHRAETYNRIIFYRNSPPTEIFRIELNTGRIYWKGRRVVTNKKLVEALEKVIMTYRCSKCGGEL